MTEIVCKRWSRTKSNSLVYTECSCMQNPTLSPGYWVRLVRYIAKNIARGESFEQQILQIPPTYSLASQTAFFLFTLGRGKKGLVTLH